MPSVSELPNFISSIRHPRRNRSVSIGPQSAADAYETLAFRQKWRKESHSTGIGARTGGDRKTIRDSAQPLRDGSGSHPNGGHFDGLFPAMVGSNGDHASAPISEKDLQMPSNSSDFTQNTIAASRSPSQDRRQNEKDEKEIFSMLEKPRVRYDVEVITKLIVYSGKNSPLSLILFH